MKVVYDERYREVYSSDPAAIPGRIESICEGKRYAVLEGGYNLEVLGKNVKSLLVGM